MDFDQILQMIPRDEDEDKVLLDEDEIRLAAKQFVWGWGPHEVYEDGADQLHEHQVRIKDRWDYRHLTEAECELVLAEAIRQADLVTDFLGLTREGHAVDDHMHTALAKDTSAAVSEREGAGHERQP